MVKDIEKSFTKRWNFWNLKNQLPLSVSQHVFFFWNIEQFLHIKYESRNL